MGGGGRVVVGAVVVMVVVKVVVVQVVVEVPVLLALQRSSLPFPSRQARTAHR
jgi:hypothetical protein